MAEHEGKIYYEKYCRIFKRDEGEIDVILDIGEKNFELFSKYNKYISREKFSITDQIKYEEKIKKMEEDIKEIEKKYKLEINVEMNKAEKIKEEYFQELEEEKNITKKWREQYNKLVVEQTKNIQEAILDREKQFNELKQIMDDNNKLQMEKLEIELNNIINNLKREKEVEEKKREEVEKELEDIRKDYGISKIKSELRGSDFEKSFFSHLSREVQSGGIWNLKKCSQEKGKGDFLLTNNFTDYRIMIELKQMKNVSATNENQQPKFIRDLTSEENNYDAGIMIATGDIVGKSNYQTDILHGKIAYYISNYKMDDIKLFMVSLKFIFDMIKNQKSKDLFEFEDAKREFLRRYKIFYETASRMKTLYETFEKNKKELCEYIWKTFNIDPDDYLVKKNREEKQTGAKKDKLIKEEEIIEDIRRQLDMVCEKSGGTLTKQLIVKITDEIAREAITNKEIRKTKLNMFTKNYFNELKAKKFKSMKNAAPINMKINI